MVNRIYSILNCQNIIMDISNKQMQDVYFLCRGNLKQFQEKMCALCKRPLESVKKISLYNKAKRVIMELNRLRKFPDKGEYRKLCEQKFMFPVQKPKPVEEINTDPPNKKQVKNEQIQSNIIQNQREQIEKLRTKLRNLKIYRINEKLKSNQKTISNLKTTVKHLRSMKSNESTSNNKTYSDKGTQCNITKTIISELKDEIDTLNMIISEHDENNNDSEISDEMKEIDCRESSQGRPYSPGLREVYYEFRSRNIALEHVNPIINSVLSLVNTRVKELPSESTTANMTCELGEVSRIQLKEEIKHSKNITMLRDGTTKKGRHFYGIEFCTDDNLTFTAGIREVQDGKGETYVDCVEEIVQDISKGDSADIMNKVQNFMTDRCATEQKVNNILKSKLHQPKNTDHSYCSPEEPTPTTNTPNDFKCAVHPLLQFSDICLKEIKKIEKELSIDVEGASRNESNTHFLLRCISKLFYKDGSGDPLLTKTFITSLLATEKIPIMNFRGNRFNLLFYNAAGSYILKQHIIHYLTSSKSSLNYVQHFILKALQNNTVLSILRSLGIICKLVTEPYWKFVEMESVSAIEMGPVYRRLLEFLQLGAKDPKLLLENKINLFCGPATQDEMYSSLFQSSSNRFRHFNISQYYCKQVFDTF